MDGAALRLHTLNVGPRNTVQREIKLTITWDRADLSERDNHENAKEGAVDGADYLRAFGCSGYESAYPQTASMNSPPFFYAFPFKINGSTIQIVSSATPALPRQSFKINETIQFSPKASHGP